MADVQRVTRQALEEVRDAVQGWPPACLRRRAASAREALSAAGIDCQVEGSATELPTEVEDLLAWALREATTNVVRHSGARVCRINVSTDTNGSHSSRQRRGAGSHRFERWDGLAGLAERARRLDGTVESGARPEGGFRLRLTVPLPTS
jgi:two-component system sensor histidine kinase DesK